MALRLTAAYLSSSVNAEFVTAQNNRFQNSQSPPVTLSRLYEVVRRRVVIFWDSSAHRSVSSK